MKKMTIRDQARLYWCSFKWMLSARKRIKIYNYCEKYGKRIVLKSIRKQIEEAEYKRQYLSVGHLRALARDIEDESYDTTESRQKEDI